ncbi:MAG: DNA primase [Haloferacaceae archaeon]
MNPLHARYPFFEAAREAVQEADVAIADLIAEDAPAVERATERVERALMSGTVASEDPYRWDPRDELLSYPLARILVSLVDDRAAVEKYAEAEAETAHGRFTEDFDADDDGLQSTGRRRADLDDVLREFDLDGAVRAEPAAHGRGPEWFRVAVGTYLTLADPDWGDRWRLVNRELADGEVRVERAELSRMLREAVRRRVAEGLPFSVRDSPGGEELADSLADEVADLRALLAEHDRTAAVDVVAPAHFPPCVTALVERARAGEDLPDHSAFALVAFLTDLGMDAAEIATLCGQRDAEATEAVETRVEYLADGDRSQYPSPSCATMQALGDCVNRDERCETIAHPMSYYGDAVRDAEAVDDWRRAEREPTGETGSERSGGAGGERGSDA